MSVDIAKRSRLQFYDLLSVDGVEFWELSDLPDIPVQTDDLVHEVIATDRIDTIAGRYYGDPVLWWVVALANGMELVPADLNEGARLRIPAPRYVLQVLFHVARGNS
jgi:hypothetical protein